jgi:hypothetical protein
MLYVPRQLSAHAPLLVLLHGSRQTGASFRRATGYAFDRLADQHGFVAVYPDGYDRHWNDCRHRGRYAARKLGLDDVGFVTIADRSPRGGRGHRPEARLRGRLLEWRPSRVPARDRAKGPDEGR